MTNPTRDVTPEPGCCMPGYLTRGKKKRLKKEKKPKKDKEKVTPTTARVKDTAEKEATKVKTVESSKPREKKSPSKPRVHPKHEAVDAPKPRVHPKPYDPNRSSLPQVASPKLRAHRKTYEANTCNLPHRVHARPYDPNSGGGHHQTAADLGHKLHPKPYDSGRPSTPRLEHADTRRKNTKSGSQPKSESPRGSSKEKSPVVQREREQKEVGEVERIETARMFKRMFSKDKEGEERKREKKDRDKEKKEARREREREHRERKAEAAEAAEAAAAATRKQKARKGGSGHGGKGSVKKRQKKNKGAPVQVDTSKPLEWPTTPECLLEYHNHKPFLTKNEEWLVVELNEFECMVESHEIIKIIAKHSKFFEVDPPELWEEFFSFVDDLPTYDEIVNYDVWQEFRDTNYEM